MAHAHDTTQDFRRREAPLSAVGGHSIPDAKNTYPRLTRLTPPVASRGRLSCVRRTAPRQTEANAATALWPPNPNELLIAS